MLCLLVWTLHHLKTAHMTNFSSPLLMITDLMCPSCFLRAPQAVSKRLHLFFNFYEFNAGIERSHRPDTSREVSLFVCNREDNIQYHGGPWSRELGQAPMLLVFLTPRQVLSSHPRQQMVWLCRLQDRDTMPNWYTINHPTTLHTWFTAEDNVSV